MSQETTTMFQTPAQPPLPPLQSLPQLPHATQATYPTTMSDLSGGTAAVTCSFPEPPIKFIQLYSDDSLSNGSAPAPPKPITDGSTYSMFGSQMTSDDTIIRSLEAQGMRRLYPREFDHKRELKKMNHSILFNFVELVDILAKCPDTKQREEKCNDIHILFIQMHHLINELRPHQARETIRVTLEVQKRERAFTAISMNSQVEKVTDAISKRLDNIPEDLLRMREAIERDIQRLKQMSVADNSEAIKSDPTDQMMQLDDIMCDIVDESR